LPDLIKSKKVLSIAIINVTLNLFGLAQVGRCEESESSSIRPQLCETVRGA